MMKSFLMIVFVLVLCVIGFGFYRGWFTTSSTSSKADSHEVNVNLTIDRDKIEADTETALDKAAELTGQAQKGASEIVDQNK